MATTATLLTTFSAPTVQVSQKISGAVGCSSSSKGCSVRLRSGLFADHLSSSTVTLTSYVLMELALCKGYCHAGTFMGVLIPVMGL